MSNSDSAAGVRDSLFAAPLGDIEGFRFNQSVVDVFPDMLRRSVPGYESIIAQSALLASRYVQPNSHLYDLGSSLGATSIAMRDALMKKEAASSIGCQIHAIDNAGAMIAASRQLIELHDGQKTAQTQQAVPIVLHEANLEEHPLTDASVVAMNFTLQFVNPDARSDLMQKIATALRPGGVLILSEKVRFDDAIVNDMHIDMYHAFKSRNGYSDLEISQKRTALENVLVPDTLEQHRDRLLGSGFAHCTVWFQCFNFASLIAIKGS
ncbi:carboxy-S-adenosyl-L-methionine synthase CmoA [Granulosicoccus antarcticus]|uniref:Carboxy-S-adenosyl-L-methionine synthase n=1 Tax=Granulosicoccus antarcticus IMCC3135 TaxID=1192854 RepID=A0A2Z2NTC6_9GAMM|nr:carboxy-S-adenosyl-L-methionine synthase CmoA [Granulosicoccus antarcticus]ASJ74523.1 Carboxy-S-adenosyl-L-methionine synthase [Granulosicoccus antarcticus IMCC3135]